MTIHTLIDPYPYSQLTVHEDYKVLAKKLNCEHKFYTIEQFAEGNIDVDSECKLFLFEPALLKLGGRTTKDIKRLFPNCKIISLSTEALTYKHGYQWWYAANITREFEIYDAHECDLWLDINDEIVEDYAKKGLRTDTWEMTTSHFLIDQFVDRPRIEKTQDIISLMGHRNSYRDSLIAFLNDRYKCQFGMHPSQANFDLEHLYQSFGSSKFVLGTTSPCWWSQRSMKGFRDWLGPICGTVLIYDNYPDVIKKYATCPIYDYNDFNTIEALITQLSNDPIEYKRILEEQIKWAKENTIAIQLYNVLAKHELI